ncbi:MAG: hypothetical protein ACLS6O_02420 [Bifidobacterium sp.]
MAERIVERLIRERDTRYGDGIYTTTQIQFAWNSNHMEGSTLTAKQTAQLFATGTYTTDGSEQVNPDDALETRNHLLRSVGFSTMLMSRWTGIWSVTCMPFSSRAPDRSPTRFSTWAATRLGRTLWQSCHSDKDRAAAGCSRIYGQAV